MLQWLEWKAGPISCFREGLKNQKNKDALGVRAWCEAKSHPSMRSKFGEWPNSKSLPSIGTKDLVRILALPTTKALKDIVFRFIIEYSSSLRDFYRPLLGNNNNRSIFIWAFLKKWYFGLCWNLRLVIIVL
jgi:hypothetical protein